MLLNRLLFRHCDLLIYVSHAQRQYWRGRGLRARRDIVIQNGVDTAHFADRLTAAQREQVRAEFGFAPDDYVIGLCGFLRPEKAHDDLLHALHQLRQRGIPAKAMLIGDGPRRAHIEQLIAQLQLQHAVVITGYRPDVRPCVASCDVMTLTSHDETFSLAALESMALGKPLVMMALARPTVFIASFILLSLNRLQLLVGLSALETRPELAELDALRAAERLCDAKSRERGVEEAFERDRHRSSSLHRCDESIQLRALSLVEA